MFYKMWNLNISLLALFISCVVGLPNSYEIIQEKVTLDYVDKKIVDAAAEIYKPNKTTALLNVTITVKMDLPANCKAHARPFKWINSSNDYTLNVIHVKDTFEEGLQMESFGLNDVFLKHTRPPVVWPIKKGVTYRCVGWAPDATKYPPNIPSGKWKVQLTFVLANNTKFLEANWFVRVTGN